MFFTNAFLNAAASEDALLTLAGVTTLSQWHSGRDVRRTIERLQTKSFIHDARLEADVASPYAMEKKMMEGSGKVFPDQRPKLCDRMASRGSPAVAKLLSASGYTDERTMHWFRKLIELAPGAARRILNLPIWRYLDPATLPYIDWHKLGLEHARDMWNSGLAGRGAWMVKIKASDDEEELEYYVPFIAGTPCRLELEGLLLGLRRWEAQGDLVAYDLYLQEALRVAATPTPHPSLAALQPLVDGFLAHVFGRVYVPYGNRNLQFQRERLDIARAAWRNRVLINRTQQATSPERLA